jgi:hypothetical protein
MTKPLAAFSAEAPIAACPAARGNADALPITSMVAPQISALMLTCFMACMRSLRV